MQIAITAAKFTPDEADGLRRAMATFRHTGNVHLFRDKFINGMAARGYDREFAEHCFGQIEGFGEYGFPESHAASFALLVYASAWIKCRYPDVFCAAILNSQPMGFYQPAQLVRDARAHGVEIREADVNFSAWDCTLETALTLPSPASGGGMSGGGHAVRLGFRLIPRACRRRTEKTHRRARQRLFLDRAARGNRRHLALHHRAAGRGGCVPLAGARSARRVMGGAPARRDRRSRRRAGGVRKRQDRVQNGAAAADAAFERRAFPGRSRRAARHAALRACRGGLRGDRAVAESASGAVFPRPPHRARRHPQCRTASTRTRPSRARGRMREASPSPAWCWCGSGRERRKASCS